jgi:diaminopimelate decarboxylase
MLEDDWLDVAGRASGHATPFYVIWRAPYEQALATLNRALSASPALPVRHWYSYKTLPVPRMARVARSLGLGIEVVSRFELAAALRLGVAPSDILVNGVAKHAWLPRDLEGLNVVFDSPGEADALASAAHTRGWRVGLRVAVSGQRGPDDARHPVQFGFDPADVGPTAAMLRRRGVAIDVLHFHLRSHVASAEDYGRALAELRVVAQSAGLTPSVIDIGGGLPEPLLGRERDGGVSLDAFARVVARCGDLVPTARSIWMEHGRHLLGSAGALVVTVQDVKRIDGVRFVVCDGGRTNQAVESDDARHGIALLDRSRQGTQTAPTVVCGPTCMAYDRLFRGEMSAGIRPGDRLIYFNTGAYHIPFETRFSHGLCRVLWTEDGASFDELRAPETPDQWQAMWR